MNRLSVSKDFVNSYFNKNKFFNNKEFVDSNGLLNFPNVYNYKDKKKRIFYALRKQRLKELLNEFYKKFGNNFIPYKGIEIEKYYPDKNMRIFTDIDLLCNNKLFNILPLPIEDFSKLYIKNEINIEIKYNFYDTYFYRHLPKKNREFLSYFYKKNKNKMDKYYHFILLSIHNFQHQFNRLDRFFDLYFLSRDNFNFSKLFKLAKQFNLDYFVRFNIFLLKELGFSLKIKNELYMPTPWEKILLIKLFNSNKNRYKLLLLVLKIGIFNGIRIFFEKTCFFDIYYIKYIRKRRAL